MFDGRCRTQARGAACSPSGRTCAKTGITADHLTGARRASWPSAPRSPSATAPCALGLLLLVLTAVPDVLDGAVAKASGTASPRGAFFDSVADRVTDALLLGGVAWYLATTQRRPHRRAAPRRARRLDAHLLRAGQGRVARLRRPGGLMERAERIIALGFGLLFDGAADPDALGDAGPHARSPPSSAS